MDWYKVIIFIVGILMGIWIADTPQPTPSSCFPICMQMIGE